MHKNNQIVYLVDKNNITKSIVSSLKKRTLDQRFCYMGKEGVVSYLNLLYDDKYQGKFENTTQNILDKTTNSLLNLNKNLEKREINFIAIGPGDGLNEKKVIKSFLENDYKVNYYPVDFSIEMLKLAVNNVSDLNCETIGINADVGSYHFIDYFKKNIKKNGMPNILTMFGNTFANFYDQYGILDTLNGCMGSQDLLLLDVVVSDYKSNKMNYLKDFQYKLKSVKNKKKMNFYSSYLLGEIGVNSDFGHHEVKVYPDDIENNILKRDHYFVFDRNYILDISGNKISFAKHEKIKIHSVIWYDKDFFKNFIENHDFDIKDSIILYPTGIYIVGVR